MKTHRVLAAASLLLLLAGCASAPPQPLLSSFSDLPVPEGMKYVPSRSGVMEGPKVEAARLVYRGRLEIESVAASVREGLEANGWESLSTVTTANRTITQVFEKPGSSLQVSLWETTWNTYLDYIVARVVSGLQ